MGTIEADEGREVEDEGGQVPEPERSAQDETAALHDQPETPPAQVAPVVVPRWVQLVLLPLAILGAWALARAAGPVLLLFVIASLIALLLNPFVALLQRARLPRTVAVFTVLIGLVTVVAGLGALLANPVADQVSALRDNVPEFIDDANAELADVQEWLDDRGIGVEIQAQGRTALETIGDRVTEGSGSVVDFTRDALTILVEASLALILVVVLSIYLLLYGERIGRGVRSIVPRGDGSPADDFPTRIQAAVFGYVRGQLMFSSIMGLSAGVMLWILGSLGIFEDGRTYALVFGAFYGFAELIPYIGPAIGAAPPVMIALFGGDGLDAVWLIVAFIALQQIEGHIVAPNVFAQALRINPILVIFALLMGGRLYGFIGAFIALPIAAMLRETVVYMRRHLVLEPWPAGDVVLAGAGVMERERERDRGGATGEGRPPPGEPCLECGASVPAGAAYCPACGTEVVEPEARASAESAAPG